MKRRRVITQRPVLRIATIGILSATNIASRIVLAFLPNIKPVTSLIIISVLLFGLTFGLEVTFVTTVVSGIYLGLGPWTIFQIFAWAVICLLGELLARLFDYMQKSPHLLVMSLFSFLMGYVFGFFVSFEKLVEGGVGLFLPYYLSGLMFDTYHAVGNFFFFIICFPIVTLIFKRDIEKHHVNI